ncbi:hypothetical protein F5887DRAFT_1076319 [Amanita rubescens]|nr:hypothetical protein F5887DRAFT_1076319 [Amanita rubescens]
MEEVEGKTRSGPRRFGFLGKSGASFAKRTSRPLVLPEVEFLTWATNLPNLILGTVLETLDHEVIVSQNLDVTAQSLVEQDGNASNETIARELHAKLKAQKVKMRTLNVEHIVPQGSKASKASQAWFEAETLAEGRAKIRDVEAASTFVSRYVSEVPQPPPTIETRDISLPQVEGIVQKARMRSRPIRV